MNNYQDIVNTKCNVAEWVDDKGAWYQADRIKCAICGTTGSMPCRIGAMNIPVFLSRQEAIAKKRSQPYNVAYEAVRLVNERHRQEEEKALEKELLKSEYKGPNWSRFFKIVIMIGVVLALFALIVTSINGSH